MTTSPRTLDELFSDEYRWTKGVAARDAIGDVVGSCSSDAVCWCISGALTKVYGESKERDQMSCRLYDNLPDWAQSYVHFNDSASTTFEDIKALIKKAGV